MALWGLSLALAGLKPLVIWLWAEYLLQFWLVLGARLPALPLLLLQMGSVVFMERGHFSRSSSSSEGPRLCKGACSNNQVLVVKFCQGRHLGSIRSFAILAFRLTLLLTAIMAASSEEEADATKAVRGRTNLPWRRAQNETLQAERRGPQNERTWMRLSRTMPRLPPHNCFRKDHCRQGGCR